MVSSAGFDTFHRIDHGCHTCFRSVVVNIVEIDLAPRTDLLARKSFVEVAEDPAEPTQLAVAAASESFAVQPSAVLPAGSRMG